MVIASSLQPIVKIRDTCAPHLAAALYDNRSYGVERKFSSFSGTNSSHMFGAPYGFDNFKGGMLAHLTVTCKEETMYDGISANPTVRFDSTHFSDDSPIEFKITATNAEGKTFTGNYIGLSYNKYASIYMDDAYYGVVPRKRAKDALEAMMHKDTGDSGIFTKAGVLKACARATALCIYAHGTNATLAPTDGPNDPETVWSTDVSGVARTPVQSFNLVFADACLTMSPGHPFPGAFGIDSNATNRA